MEGSTPRYRDVAVGGVQGARVTTRSDGTLEVASNEALGPYPDRLTERLAHWASRAPERVFIAARTREGSWREVSYGAMLGKVRSIAGALAERKLSVDAPIMILSGNEIEQAVLTLGAMWAGVPVAPVSPAYSLVSEDFVKLRRLVQVMTPGLVYAATPEFARAIHAAIPDTLEVVLGHGALAERPYTPFAALCEGDPLAGDQAHERVGPETIAKFLFTSGSTKLPKAVPNTQRMLCSNQQMLLQTFPFFADEPPVLVDWLPWSHTFGGNHNFGLVLYNGGTLYIDEGKPVPALFQRTLANLREIAPTVYFNVPKGWEDLALALEHDEALCKKLFSRVRLFFYAAASLSQPVWDRLDALAERTIGCRIRMVTGFGMTETSPSAMFTPIGEVRAGQLGLPCPGCETKLVPVDDKLEVRFRGPHVMAGYWRAAPEEARPFDDEGYYRTGDALRPIDRARPERGFAFDGRLAEDFKLSSGTFVSVGPLRSHIVACCAPYVSDVVLAGINRASIAAIFFPQPDALRRLAGLGEKASLAEASQTASVRAAFQGFVDRIFKEGTGSASRISHALIATELPSLDSGEVTDKGSLNQRMVLKVRAEVIDALYAGRLPQMIVPSPEVVELVLRS